jgi:predicted ATP-dependent endonuclease of OLD family
MTINAILYFLLSDVKKFVYLQKITTDAKMIQSIAIQGLNGRKTPIELSFNEGLNIFTGKNGCGKTTLLKTLWFIQSGNFMLLKREVAFSKIVCEIKSDGSKEDVKKITIEKNSSKVTISRIGQKDIEYDFEDGEMSEDNWRTYIDLDKEALENLIGDKSVFFSTFRRIEGGFGLKDMPFRLARIGDGNIIRELSKTLSTNNHKFVASISTDDISRLVNEEYSRRSEKINRKQQEDYEKIKKIVQNGNVDNDKLISYVEDGEAMRQDLLKPFSVLQDTIKRFFQDKGIHLKNMTLGDVEHSVDSDKLSSGEKQMLSFLCYNLFSDSASIYIDEPELSLHPDWQRVLLPTLLKQSTNNQFFIATHSPFIYASYPDKEFVLSEDRGYKNE